MSLTRSVMFLTEDATPVCIFSLFLPSGHKWEGRRVAFDRLPVSALCATKESIFLISTIDMSPSP